MCLSLSIGNTNNNLSRSVGIRVIKAINDNFKRLERLKFKCNFVRYFQLPSFSFTGCKRLTHLSIYPVLGKIFMNSFLSTAHFNNPRLRVVEIIDTDINHNLLTLLLNNTSIQTIKTRRWIYTRQCHDFQQFCQILNCFPPNTTPNVTQTKFKCTQLSIVFIFIMLCLIVCLIDLIIYDL